MGDLRYVRPRTLIVTVVTQCFVQLLRYKEQFIELISLLVEKTKSERGYSGTGRLLNRMLHTLAGVYPLNARFVNTDEWDDLGEKPSIGCTLWFSQSFC